MTTYEQHNELTCDCQHYRNRHHVAKPYCPTCGGPHRNHMVMRLRHALRHTHPRRPVIWLRLAWHDFILHGLLDRGRERCQDCGRGYLLWMAPDALYVEVHGNAGGTLCPSCFDRAGGHRFVWVPFVWELDDGSDIKERINAADWAGSAV